MTIGAPALRGGCTDWRIERIRFAGLRTRRFHTPNTHFPFRTAGRSAGSWFCSDPTVATRDSGCALVVALVSPSRRGPTGFLVLFRTAVICGGDGTPLQQTPSVSRRIP